MRRARVDLTRAFNMLSMIALTAVALAAVAGRCDGSDDFPLSFETPTCTDRETIPTAIPTEEWTPEWLAGWSDIANAAARRRHDATAERLSSRNISMADVQRAEILAEWVGTSLDETLREADTIISGEVTGQKLGIAMDGERQRKYLLSRVEDGTTSLVVAQPIGLECSETGIRLGYVGNQPLLEVGRTYAIPVDDEQVAGAFRALPHTFVVQNGSMNDLYPRGDSLASLEELRQRFEAAR